MREVTRDHDKIKPLSGHCRASPPPQLVQLSAVMCDVQVREVKNFHTIQERSKLRRSVVGGRRALLLQRFHSRDDLLQLPDPAVINADGMLVQPHRVLWLLRHAHMVSLRPLASLGKRSRARLFKKLATRISGRLSHIFSDRRCADVSTMRQGTACESSSAPRSSQSHGEILDGNAAQPAGSGCARKIRFREAQREATRPTRRSEAT